MSKKAKHKKSGSAVFMYIVIALTLITAAACFVLYYGGFFPQNAILWAGITAFTIMYHLWLRIIMGNVSKLFRISFSQWWFRERDFEKKIYRILKVKKWKGKALTYNPELYDIKSRTLTQLADTTAKSELDHWLNVLISVTTIGFGLIWGQMWIFAVTAFFAALFDLHFVVIQRYNRPRLVRLINRARKKR